MCGPLCVTVLLRIDIMKRISSKVTFYYKLLGIIISVLFTPVAIVFLFQESLEISDKAFLVLLFLFFPIMTILLSSLKEVYIKEDKLVVKNYRKTVEIEKWEIKRIEQSTIFFRPCIMTIYTKWETEFGFKFRFIPYDGWLIFWNHKIVNEVQKWID